MFYWLVLLSFSAALSALRPQNDPDNQDLGTHEAFPSGLPMRASASQEPFPHDSRGNSTILHDENKMENEGLRNLAQDLTIKLAQLTKSSFTDTGESQKPPWSQKAMDFNLPQKQPAERIARREPVVRRKNARRSRKGPEATAARGSLAQVQGASSSSFKEKPPLGPIEKALQDAEKTVEQLSTLDDPQTADVETSSSKKSSSVPSPEQIWQQISQDVTSQDVDTLSKHLQNASIFLQAKSDAFDVNAVMSAPLAQQTAESKATAASVTGEAQGLTLMAHAAQDGWLPGVRELVDWNRGRKDKGEQLRLDEGGLGTTPLTLAAEKKHADVVRYLIEQRASVTAPNRHGLTPLEVAAGVGDSDVVEALLANGSELANGLASLRVQLATDGDKLPRLTARMQESSQDDEHKQMDSLRAVVPVALQPTTIERAAVGDFPADWVILYKNRVMHALASASSRSLQVEHLLAANTFDSFARDFSLTIVMLTIVLGAFALFMYIVFRLRLYGGLEVPVSLSHMVPGAFNPIRLADPDFDPSRMKQRLPYRTSAASLSPHPPSLAATATSFMKALLGVFCSWSFQCVRIPPEKEAFDEDYLSDDDEKSRVKVCEQCAARARSVHSMEVVIRNVVFFCLLWWLCWKARRWNEASILLFLYLQYSLVASCVSMSMVPAPAVPEKAGNDNAASDPDGAQLVYALFDVQYGPRWRRSICTTRSTATLSKSTTRAARRRQRRPRREQDRERQDGAPEEVSSGAEPLTSSLSLNRGTASDGVHDTQASPIAAESTQREGEVVSTTSMGGPLSRLEPDVPYSQQWQRAFLQSGTMHIQHGAYLEGSVANVLVIALSLLWLTHLRTLAQGSFLFFYMGTTPVHLFEVYGVPGTIQRCTALVLEMFMLGLAGERLLSITSLLLVSALSLQQRHRALLFASDHQPPAVQRKRTGPEEATMVKEAIHRIDECVTCSEFATELSTLRWAVLRTPLMLVLASTLMLLGLAISSFSMMYVESIKSNLVRCGFMVDPMVPLSLGLCLTWPLLLALIAAALANNEVLSQRRQVESSVNDAIWAMPSGDEADDVQYVRLRLKAKEALQDSMLCWPGGRELGFCEPSLLIAFAVLAGSLAVATGAAIPSLPEV